MPTYIGLYIRVVKSSTNKHIRVVKSSTNESSTSDLVVELFRTLM